MGSSLGSSRGLTRQFDASEHVDDSTMTSQVDRACVPALVVESEEEVAAAAKRQADLLDQALGLELARITSMEVANFESALLQQEIAEYERTEGF